MSAGKKNLSGKWVARISPSQLAVQAAEAILRQRWQVVLHGMRRVNKHWRRDPEFVHQLRVATRRAAVAGQLFASFLPPKKARRIRKWLKILRQSAGQARDLDVMMERLALPSPTEHLPRTNRTRLLRLIRKQRRQVQGELDSRTSKTSRRVAARLLDSIKFRSPSKSTTFQAAAHDSLRPLLDSFFAAAEGDLGTIEAIHQLRIHGKKSRYAMETLASAFSATFRNELYVDLCDLQQALGDINDLATAIEHYQSWQHFAGSALQADLQQLIDTTAIDLEQRCHTFRSTFNRQTVAELKRRFAVELDSPNRMIANGHHR